MRLNLLFVAITISFTDTANEHGMLAIKALNTSSPRGWHSGRSPEHVREHHVSPAGGEILEPERVFRLELLQEPGAVLTHAVHDVEHALLFGIPA